nr:reverse transcriptase domain-containing protein [Tanacetum cinerariifolium]
MKFTRLVMLAKQLKKCGKLSKGYNKPEWSRFMTIVKQQHKLDEDSYHKLFDILKQYQKEVNELRAKRLARKANPLALKNLDLIAKYFIKIYKPTNNNLKTSSNSRNKNVDTTPRYKNDNQSRQFGNQRMVNVVGARKNVGSLAVQQTGIQCSNCKEFGHFAKECRKPKRVKDSAYHKEKMLLCKQAEKGELEAYYSYMEKIQEVPTADTCTNSEPLEHVQNDTGYNVFANDLQHFEKSESISNTCLVEMGDSNVIPNSPNILKLDVDESKKIQKKLNKANITLAQELKECKTILAETSETLGESNSVRDSCLVSLQNKQTEFEKYKVFNDRTVDYDKLERAEILAADHLSRLENTYQDELEKKEITETFPLETLAMIAFRGDSSTPWIALDLEASRSRGFVHRLLKLQSLAYGNPIS